MKYKTLKHKTLPETYGVMYGSDDSSEIGQTNIPFLQPYAATYDLVKEYWKNCPLVMEQIEDYELVEFPLKKLLKSEHFKYPERLIEWVNKNDVETVSICAADKYGEGCILFYR